MYQNSINFIKNMEHKPSKNEWNILAKEYDLLSTYSLRMITNISSFSKLCSIVRKSNNQ